ncbi:hypothetical protein PHSC3_000425 [Chlamydiales bacterium STE3]|nr:hypothetical protein PHSC3_000425 [Chlamydiales bacterium STE3]
MSIIWTIIIGFIVGLFARVLMSEKDALGFILTTLLGMGDAILGKYLGNRWAFIKKTIPLFFLCT